MAISAKLQFKQSQSLVMTPQLMQSIKLLQMNNIELATFIDQELEKNPILERLDNQDTYVRGEGANVEPQSQRAKDDTSPLGERIKDSLDAGTTSVELSDQLSESALANVYDAGTSGADGNSSGPTTVGTDPWKTSTSGAGGSFDGDLANMEAFVADQPSLHQYLERQAGLQFRDAVELGIAREIIASLDDDGYLRRDIDDITEVLNTSIDRVELVLSSVQAFEPVGIASRDLGECLARQLREKDRFDPAMQSLIENLELLAKRDYPALLKACEISREDLVDMISEIRDLEPRPASRFDTAPIAQIVPDVFVNPREDGGWAIELNHDTLPRVLINETYYAEVSGVVKNQADKEFLTDCMQSANWLIRGLDQRAKTILKVTSEIVKQQDRFFAYGVEHLRPLNLKTVAEAIKMHESTVSRVTNNKYVMTNRGIFELKYFFTAAISGTEGGDAHSAETVRHKIKQLIEAETLESVLSDDAIVEILKQSAIDIARRTVAKYREAMNIPSSVQRRRELKNAEMTRGTG